MFLKGIAKQVYSYLFKGKTAKSKTEGTSCSPLSKKPEANTGVSFSPSTSKLISGLSHILQERKLKYKIGFKKH